MNDAKTMTIKNGKPVTQGCVPNLWNQDVPDREEGQNTEPDLKRESRVITQENSLSEGH